MRDHGLTTLQTKPRSSILTSRPKLSSVYMLAVNNDCVNSGEEVECQGRRRKPEESFILRGFDPFLLTPLVTAMEQRGNMSDSASLCSVYDHGLHLLL